MPRIHRLPPSLVNKIAAGEVVERPASVLKELVENCLDAGASRVDIALEQGGRSLIRVTDDGAGMDADDLSMCVQPHTTSKLNDESDLFALHTMGFRGEALASIASVSQMRIITRTAGSDQAYCLEVEGGVCKPVAPAAADYGTTIEVRNLFFNTPARRKFLKADSTEMAHHTEGLARIALAQTDIHFRLTHNGRLAYDLPATARLGQRIGDFFGDELAGTLMPVEFIPPDKEAPSVRGLVAPPQHSRPSAKWQYLFLNGRFIRDRFVQHALREAYRGLMEPSRQPVAFLFMLLPPELVDFNVHPQKIEVRFADSNRVHSAVLRALRDKLTRTDLSARGHSPDGPPGPPVPVAREESSGAPIDLSQLDAPEDDAARQSRIREAMAQFMRPAETSPQQKLAFPSRPSSPPVARTIPTTEGGCAIFAADGGAAAPIFPVVQVHNTYLVQQTDEGLVIIDQHALHERIIYETLYHRLTDPSRSSLESQRMLIAQRVVLGARQAGLLLDQTELLTRLGIELSAFSRDEVAINAFPAFLERLDPAGFVRDLADQLADEPPASPEALLHEVLDMMACKAAVKAGDPLTQAEIAALLAQAPLVERSTNCPHGRPTMLRFSLAELEKQFKRR